VTPLGVLFSIIGWILAQRALNAMRHGRADRQYQGIAEAARLLGIIGVCISAVYWAILALMLDLRF
jgi:cytochrome c biogenesis protein ResB